MSSLFLLLWVVSRFPVFPSDTCFLRRHPWFFTPKFLATIFPRVVPLAWCANGGVGWGGVGRGPLGDVEAFLSSYAFYEGVIFNLPAQFSITDPSLAPFPTGDWVVKLHRSYVSRISRPRLWFDNLPTPVLAKGVRPFLLPRLNPIVQVRPGLSSRALHLLK